MSPSRKRAAVHQLQSEFGIPERQACRVLDQPRSSQRYESQPRNDEASLTKRMRVLAKERPRFGYRQIARLLRREGWRASDTRVCRLWRREGLKVPQKKRKRRRLGTSDNGCKRRPENAALGGEWWSAEKRSAQVITRGCRGRVSGFPENSDRADCGGQECSLTWSCGLRFAVGFRAAS